MRDEEIKLGNTYWTSFFLSRPQGDDVEWRAVAVKVVKKITHTFLLGKQEATRTCYECRCEGYEKPTPIPALYCPDGMPEEYFKEFKYGEWPDNKRTFYACQLYPDMVSCLNAMYKRFRKTADNMQRDLENNTYTGFAGDLVIGGIQKL